MKAGRWPKAARSVSNVASMTCAAHAVLRSRVPCASAAACSDGPTVPLVPRDVGPEPAQDASRAAPAPAAIAVLRGLVAA